MEPLRLVRLRTWSGICLLALLAWGCTGSAPPTAPPAAGGARPAGDPAAAARPAESAALPARIPLKMAYTAITANQALFWIAVEAGLFAEEGLDVDLMRVESSARALPAMLAGELPVSLLATGAIASAVVSTPARL